MSTFRTRFAPSPTYYLHLGHAASALQVWRWADEIGAEVLLRIEDIDTTRCRPEYTEAIYEDLRWLGLEWPAPVRTQSDHFSDYAACVEALTRRGLTYRCFRTRQDVANLTEPLRPGPHAIEEEAALLAAGAPFAWRLSLAAAEAELGAAWTRLFYVEETAHGRVEHSADPSRLGDIVIARKDSPSAYHLAATHDDARQLMTHIIRGVDLIEAPHIQVLLQKLMDWPPVTYRHHALVRNEQGEKLSKRQRSITLASLRADGMTAQQVRTRLGFG
ncbi:MAG: tRNA glutamyl-Q(34) synthetase GluQRS [Pseudomonadota bacterium]